MFNLKSFRREVGLSQKELADMLGCVQSNISMMERTNKNPEKHHMRILIDKFGEDVVNRFSLSSTDDDTNCISDNDYVPLLPVEAMAGTLQGFSEGVALRDCKKIKSPVEGADWAIQISGDSMEPEYRNGSYLYIKKMSGKFVPWGHTLVVDTIDGVVVKKIFPIDGTDEYIEARSINTKYPPFKIETSCILGMYRVLGGSFINSTI